MSNADSSAEALRKANGTREGEPPHYKVQRIREALAHDRRVGKLELAVTVRAGKALITGSVPSPEVQSAISEVVKEVAPELELHNQTVVAAYPESEEVERL